MKDKNENEMELDLNAALVLRLSSTELETLIKTINDMKLNVLYRKTSYAPLYITKEEPQWK